MENTGLPKHIGIIMDGNGRWAQKRGLPRKLGHKEGSKAFQNITSYANKLGISYITYFALSTENLNRPKDELDAIYDLMRSYIKNSIKQCNKDNIRINFIGDISVLPQDIQDGIADIEKKTSENTGLFCNLAFNYGGRQDILNAAKKLAKIYKDDKDFSIYNVSEEDFSNYLYTAGQPDLDLVIRTSGEKRISNFLLWQAAYAEILFVDTLWPDFNDKDFDSAIVEFKNRNRRYGRV